MQQDGLEVALSETAERVGGALRASAAVNRELKRASTSAATGSVRELRRALDATIAAGEALISAAREARDSYQLDDVEYLASGDYGREVLWPRPPSVGSRCLRRTIGCCATRR